LSWYNDPFRHSLASKGVRTSYGVRNFKKPDFTNTSDFIRHYISDCKYIESPVSKKSNVVDFYITYPKKDSRLTPSSIVSEKGNTNAVLRFPTSIEDVKDAQLFNEFCKKINDDYPNVKVHGIFSAYCDNFKGREISYEELKNLSSKDIKNLLPHNLTPHIYLSVKGEKTDYMFDMIDISKDIIQQYGKKMKLI